MTAAIARVSGIEAYDLIYPEHLAMLSEINQETMKRCMHNSTQVWIGYEGDKVLCFLGLIPPTLLSDRAYLWLQTTEHLHSHLFIFIRYSQRLVAEMLEHYPVIVGHTEITNTKAIRWLRWLGATFGEPQAPGVYPFEIKAK